MSTETGGPAFPQNTKIVAAAGQELHQGFMGGMTLRDYFAAKAMQGLCANPNAEPSIGQEVWAKAAYQVADAMLKERSA